MKRKFTKIISMIACAILCVTCFVACGNNDWSKNVTLKEYDASTPAKSNGGFVVERGDYIYFVNGVQNYATDNKFGSPVKGALMVAKKDLSKVEILLPKIIASGDYTAGIYVFGDYVYYATPSTTKTGSGVVNYNDLVFARTKLDGSMTEEFLTVTGNTTMFRYAQVNGNVYLYYVAENAINQYAVSTKETTEIANVEGAEYKFFPNDQIEATGYVVAYTQNVKDETKEDANLDYNELYACKVGEAEGQLVLSGKETETSKLDKKVSLSYSPVDGSLIYKLTATSTEEHVYAYDLAEQTTTEIKNVNYLGKGSIVALDEVYYVENSIIYKATLLDVATPTKQVVADGASTIITKDGNFVYYLDGSKNVCRIELTEDNDNVIKVSSMAVEEEWYVAEIVDGKVYYPASATDGKQVIYRVDLSAEVKTEGEGDDAYDYIDGEVKVGILTEAEELTIFDEQVAKLTGTVSYNTDGEIALEEKIAQAKATYDDLSARYGAKKLNADNVKTLTNYINALNACKALRGVVGIKNPSAEAIATATEAMEKLGEDNYGLLLGSDIGWWQDAVKNQAE